MRHWVHSLFHLEQAPDRVAAELACLMEEALRHQPQCGLCAMDVALDTCDCPYFEGLREDIQRLCACYGLRHRNQPVLVSMGQMLPTQAAKAHLS